MKGIVMWCSSRALSQQSITVNIAPLLHFGQPPEQKKEETGKVEWPQDSSMSYREFVQAQKHNNPCLAGLSNFLYDSDSDRRPCRILKLDFSPDRKGTLPDFQHVDLKTLQQTVCSEKGRRRILIIEDLRRDVIELLGSEYAIDPVFFGSHIHAPFRQMDSQTPNLALLPSRQQGQNFVNFHYHRAVTLEGDVENENRLTRDMNVERKIAVLLPLEMTRLALVQHACSVALCHEEDGNGWLCKSLRSMTPLAPPADRSRHNC
jgi:hypothetical protein